MYCVISKHLLFLQFIIAVLYMNFLFQQRNFFFSICPNIKQRLKKYFYVIISFFFFGRTHIPPSGKSIKYSLHFYVCFSMIKKCILQILLSQVKEVQSHFILILIVSLRKYLICLKITSAGSHLFQSVHLSYLHVVSH